MPLPADRPANRTGTHAVQGRGARLDERRTSQPPADRRVTLRRIAPLGALVGVAVFIVAMGWHRELSIEALVRHHAALKGFVASGGPAAVAAFVAFYVAVVALSIPGAVLLTIAGGVLFGGLIGAAASVVGATLGASALFLVARTAFGEHLVRRAGPRAARLVEGFRADGFHYLLFLRLVPAFPFFLINLVPALVGMRLMPFVAATAIGILPATFVFAFLGSGFDGAIANQAAAHRACVDAGGGDCRIDFDLVAALTPELIAAFAGLGLLALVPVAARRLRRRRAAVEPR